MKKFLTLVLALVLVFGLSVPAMAFTSDTSDDVDHPYDLSIYLVEYDDNDLFGMVALPESDRGYAKNEIVAAVVELYVPKNEDPSEDYNILEFGGDNVKLNVTDNDGGDLSAVKVTSPDAFTINSDGDKMTRDAGTAGLAPTSNTTYKWLFFAKVTDDDASLYAKLVDGDGSDGFTGGTLTVTLSGIEYTVVDALDPADADGKDRMYTITWTDGTDQLGIRVYTNDKYKSTGMAIDADTTATQTWTNLGVNTSGELGIVSGATIVTDSTLYDNVMDIYEDVVVDVFGLDYFNIGNYVRNSYFEGLTSADTIIATVDIEPWTAYVTVPDNIVVDPPKTGDAASIMGFVMVALSGAGAVALKKRG